MDIKAPGTPAGGLNDQAYETIRNDIITCLLAPGEEVSEARLVASYGFGKAPTRHALSRLGQEGYVMSVPRRGHIISPVTLQTVNDVFELRLLLEPHAVARACGNADIVKLNQLADECSSGYTPGDLASEAHFITSNRRFHMEIARAARNGRLTRAIGQIMDETTRLLYLGLVLRARPPELESDHQDLIDALARNDPDKGREISATHIERVKSLVIQGILTHSNLSHANIAPT